MSVGSRAGKRCNGQSRCPSGSLSVNAVPGQRIGGRRRIRTTPLANVTLPIGTHEVVWRHPQLGERRRTIAITTKTPTRVGMDFKQ